jgi:hypothetical protein
MTARPTNEAQPRKKYRNHIESASSSGAHRISIRKSRPSVILFRSIVTRLLMRPTRLLAPPSAASASAASTAALAFTGPEDDEAAVLVVESPVAVRTLPLPRSGGAVLSLAASVSVSSSVASVRAGDGARVGGAVRASGGASAFMRTRSACANTSCVMSASARTRVRVL